MVKKWLFKLETKCLFFLSEKICKRNWNLSADSLGNGRILKKCKNHPWIRITGLDYNVKQIQNVLRLELETSEFEALDSLC